MVYLSNEDPTYTEVYFDDLTITLNEHPVIQMDDYYPFGLAHSNGYQRVSAQKNRFLFGSKELQTDLDLGWMDFHARQYDPSLGRMLSLDPHADAYYNVNPYNYVVNNPISFVDPDGKDFRLIAERDDSGNLTITFQSTVHVYGGSSSEEQIEELNKEFNELAAKITFGDNDQHTVQFDVNFVHHDSQEDAINGVESNPGDNLLQFDEKLSDSELFQFALYENSENKDVIAPDVNGTAKRGGREANARNKNSIFHEVGHLFGLGDRYSYYNFGDRKIALPSLGFSGDIMANNKNGPDRIDRVHFLNLFNFSSNSLDPKLKKGDSRTKIFRDKRVPEPDRKRK